MISEKKLWSACRQGDEEAFRALFDRYHRRLFHIAFRLCGSIEEAEDTLQEVFIRVYKESSKFDADASFFTWLYRITMNVCIDKKRKHLRRAKYRAQVDLITMESARAVNSDSFSHEYPEQAFLRNEVQHFLQRALDQVKLKFRTVIFLTDIEGLTYAETSRILGCSEGTVSSRLTRGRMQLKNALVKMGIDRSYFEES